MLLALTGAALAAACAERAETLPTLERATPQTPEPAGPSSADTEADTTTSTTTPTTSSLPQAPPVDLHALRPPRPADDPQSLAAQIAAAEATLADPAAKEMDIARAALAQQVAYRRLGDRPDWDGAVLAELAAHLHRRVQLHAQARREFTSMHTRLSDTLPAWEIIPPEPAEQLMAHYRAAEATFGVRWEHLAAINLVETGMGRIRGYSVAGARGPMQFMPRTWEAFGEGDIDDPRDAILAAARYLAHSGYHEDWDRALFAYNRHNAYVRGVRAYADLMIEDPAAFLGLYHWGIVYRSAHGDIYLPVGYNQTERIPVLDYLARTGEQPIA